MLLLLLIQIVVLVKISFLLIIVLNDIDFNAFVFPVQHTLMAFYTA